MECEGILDAPVGSRRKSKRRWVEVGLRESWLPRWAGHLISRSTRASSWSSGRIRFHQHVGKSSFFSRWVIVEATVEDAKSLQASEFIRVARQVYREVREAVDRKGLLPLRFWNCLPGIHSIPGGRLDRYRLFNLARTAELTAWLGLHTATSSRYPPATGIGHTGWELKVACLSTAVRAREIENPRQCPAYRYSRRFGPKPPCFSRAAVVESGGQRCLLISGTASGRGEESQHQARLGAQIDETLINLRALLETGLESRGDLRSLLEARAYVRDLKDIPIVGRKLLAGLPSVELLELAQADLCRPELLMEIEGVAAKDSWWLEP